MSGHQQQCVPSDGLTVAADLTHETRTENLTHTAISKHIYRHKAKDEDIKVEMLTLQRRHVQDKLVLEVLASASAWASASWSSRHGIRTSWGLLCVPLSANTADTQHTLIPARGLIVSAQYACTACHMLPFIWNADVSSLPRHHWTTLVFVLALYDLTRSCPSCAESHLGTSGHTLQTRRENTSNFTSSFTWAVRKQTYSYCLLDSAGHKKPLFLYKGRDVQNKFSKIMSHPATFIFVIHTEG